MYYYLDVEQAKIGRVLMLLKSETRIPDIDTTFGKGVAVELIGDSLPFGVVYDDKAKTVRAATVSERQKAALKRLYSGVELLGKVWTKDDFTMDTFVKKAGDTVTGTLNLTGTVPLKIPHNKGISVFKGDGSTAGFGKTDGTKMIITENVSSSVISSPCDIKGNLNVTGVVMATGDIVGMSDKRIKKDIKPIKDPWRIVEQLHGYKYKLKLDNTDHIGLIAQEVERVIPEAVYTDTDSGYKAIAYGNLAGLFVELLNDLNKRLRALEGHSKVGETHNE